MGESGVDDIAIVSLDSGMAVSLGLYSRTSAMGAAAANWSNSAIGQCASTVKRARCR